jgi:hypothetical protein
MNQATRWRQLFGTAAILTAVGAGRVEAQQSRDSLVAKAQGEFDTGRRLQLLRTAVNPEPGPLDASWSTAVQLLGQTLLEDKQDSLANTWLRWATRLLPSLEADTVQFPSSLATALRGAKDFTRSTQSPGDQAITTSWQWAAPDATDHDGKLLVTAPGITGQLAASVAGGPDLSSEPTTLAPGSYQIRASAKGYDSVAVTREVLPGTTTLLELKLKPMLAQANAQGPAKVPTVPPVATETKRKKFPWAIVALGVAGVGGAVAAFAGGGGKSSPPPPTTGGITIVFPNQ